MRIELRKAARVTLSPLLAAGLDVLRTKAARAALLLLLAAGAGVLPSLAQARSSPASKSRGTSTRSSSHRNKSSRRSRRRDRGQKAPTTERISEIQQALAKDGSYAGTPSGKWDDSTVEATKKFQQSHGLAVTGKLDARTLQQLGLGAPTAGVAPPAPSNTTSKLTSPSTQAVQRRN